MEVQIEKTEPEVKFGMLRIAIVEDEQVHIKPLEGYLQRFEKENHEHLELTFFHDGDEIVEDYKCEFDVVLR